ncbi:MAG: RDD family protein [Streptosporangiales bacterium]|nr:RDD family protein [Streptosporangiales bacterium]
MSELVTGEAVVLDIRVAKVGSRAVAKTIDMLIQLSVLFAIVYWMPEPALDEAAGQALLITLMVAVIVGYPTASETLWRGKTVGKAALGLRTVRDDGGPISFRQALFRALTGFLEFWATAGLLAVLSSFVSHRGKRLGDAFTGTIVIAERAPGRRRQLIDMPPGTEHWAATLELAALPDELALAARQYLTRFEDFTPDQAERLGRRIAGQVSARVTPPPPPHLPPYVYLAAVLAERRRREAIRLQPGWSPVTPR